MNHDAQLQNEVQRALLADASIHSEQIGVSSCNGVVQLDGTVKSYFEKWTAQDTALRVTGVASVANEIKVAIVDSDNRSDSDLARIIISQLQWNYTVPDTVKVSVADGWVQFEGSVEAKYQKDEAERVLRSLKGIKGVRNRIVIKPGIDVTLVKESIVDSFKRNAVIKADSIQVEVKEGTVTLRGPIGSWLEGEEVRRAAWAMEGVTEVQDELFLTPPSASRI